MTSAGAAPNYCVGSAGDLVVYALGPGFGESVVVVASDGATVVVDACMRAGENLSETLLTALGRTTIDLLVFSHPDTDHVRGGARLLKHFHPSHTWVWPLAVSLRTHLANVLREDPSGSHAVPLQDLDALLGAVEDKVEHGIAETVQSNTASWFSPGSACAVHPLAPSQSDLHAAGRQITNIIERRGKKFQLSDRVAKYLRGEVDGSGDHPNLLSIALSVECGTRRIVLGGDVEAGRHKHSGWQGVLWRLRRHKLLQRVQAVDVVKVAHHGSDNAYWKAAWQEHCAAKNNLVAVVCPFNKSGELPAAKALGDLRTHAATLAITNPSHTVSTRVVAAKWNAVSPSVPCVTHADWTLPVVAVVLPASGPATLHLASGARAWCA